MYSFRWRPLPKRPTVSQTIEAIQGLLYKFVGPDLYIYTYIYVVLFLYAFVAFVARCSQVFRICQIDAGTTVSKPWYRLLLVIRRNISCSSGLLVYCTKDLQPTSRSWSGRWCDDVQNSSYAGFLKKLTGLWLCILLVCRACRCGRWATTGICSKGVIHLRIQRVAFHGHHGSVVRERGPNACIKNR